MLLKNNTKNTLYLEDIDVHIPYKNGHPQVIQPYILKRSKCLRGFIISGLLDVIEFDEKERIEASVMHLRAKMKTTYKTEHHGTHTTESRLSASGINLQIRGLFYDASGYAKVNRNLALSLKKLGVNVRIEPKNSRNQLDANTIKPLKEMEQIQLPKQYISIDSVIPSFADFSSAKYSILYTTIESNTLPEQFIEACKMYREIWVTSYFAKEVLSNYDIAIPIHVIPASIDHHLYTEQGPRFELKPSLNSFVFVSVFAWGKRKGYDILLRAYFDEFDADDDISLLIVSRYQGNISEKSKKKIQNDIHEIIEKFPNKKLPHIMRYSEIIPEKDMPKLYRAADCFIITPFGEGSNLCAPEASLCGLPVIMTYATGQQQYLREDNAFLIHPNGSFRVRQGEFGPHYWDNQEFPNIRSERVHKQIKTYMREVYANYSFAKERNKNLQQLILNKFTWEKTAQIALTRLKEISQKIRSS